MMAARAKRVTVPARRAQAGGVAVVVLRFRRIAVAMTTTPVRRGGGAEQGRGQGRLDRIVLCESESQMPATMVR